MISRDLYRMKINNTNEMIYSLRYNRKIYIILSVVLMIIDVYMYYNNITFNHILWSIFFFASILLVYLNERRIRFFKKEKMSFLRDFNPEKYKRIMRKKILKSIS